ncbi:TIR domain-containing protein [Nitrospirillum sp. BR 11752]|uniref:TIR domain-containing protein n=1 Tax=Nitrospirillum sp. BR 11752 TaxID=3104293 RepID=UPI002EC2F90F|nr:TIR domain-containing protein [Nitrospirillum sp. BR 11752]
MPTTTTASRYAAYISYSHKDGAIAARLHKRLERYSIPWGVASAYGKKYWFGRKIGRVFRDREELAAGQPLAPLLYDALARSDALIVLCSANAATSRYVNDEIKEFRRLGKSDRIFPVIIDDDPPACYPPELRQAGEKLNADFRAGKDGEVSGTMKILAGLMGLGLDQLIQREQRTQRRRIIGLSMAVGVLAFLAGVAWWSYLEAQRQHEIAVANLITAIKTINSMTKQVTNMKNQIGIRSDSLKAFLSEIASNVAELPSRVDPGDIQREGGDLATVIITLQYRYAEVYDLLGDRPAQRAAIDEGLRQVAARLAPAPRDLHWLDLKAQGLMLLGDVLRATKLEDARAPYAEAVDIRKAIAQVSGQDADWQRLTESYDRLGDVERTTQHFPEAWADYMLAFDLRAQLLAKDPNNEDWRRAAAQEENRLGDTLRRGEEYFEVTNTSPPPSLPFPKTHEEVLYAALTHYKRSLALREDIAAKNRLNANDKWNYVWSLGLVGDGEREVADFTSALDHFRHALDLTTSLLQLDPERVDLLTEMAKTLERLGKFHQELSRIDQALQGVGVVDQMELQEALLNFINSLKQFQELSVSHPDDRRWKLRLFFAEYFLGDLQRKMACLAQTGEDRRLSLFKEAKDHQAAALRAAADTQHQFERDAGFQQTIEAVRHWQFGFPCALTGLPTSSEPTAPSTRR